MTKQEFLDSLNDCYTRLAPTEHGVGVVAIRDIPKGTNPFKHCPDIAVIEITQEEFANYDPEVVRLIKDMCAKQNGVYHVPATGIDSIGKNYYVNHSQTPNLVTLDEGETFITARNITKGEELTVDYRTYDESDLFLPTTAR